MARAGSPSLQLLAYEARGSCRRYRASANHPLCTRMLERNKVEHRGNRSGRPHSSAVATHEQRPSQTMTVRTVVKKPVGLSAVFDQARCHFGSLPSKASSYFRRWAGSGGSIGPDAVDKRNGLYRGPQSFSFIGKEPTSMRLRRLLFGFLTLQMFDEKAERLERHFYCSVHGRSGQH
jgi:hypothetical protein